MDTVDPQLDSKYDGKGDYSQAKSDHSYSSNLLYPILLQPIPPLHLQKNKQDSKESCFSSSCSRCKKDFTQPVSESKTFKLCTHCRDLQRQRSRRWQKKTKNKLGACRRCGSDIPLDQQKFVLCPNCRQNLRSRKASRAAQKKCVHCSGPLDSLILEKVEKDESGLDSDRSKLSYLNEGKISYLNEGGKMYLAENGSVKGDFLGKNAYLVSDDKIKEYEINVGLVINGGKSNYQILNSDEKDKSDFLVNSSSELRKDYKVCKRCRENDKIRRNNLEKLGNCNRCAKTLHENDIGKHKVCLNCRNRKKKTKKDDYDENIPNVPIESNPYIINQFNEYNQNYQRAQLQMQNLQQQGQLQGQQLQQAQLQQQAQSQQTQTQAQIPVQVSVPISTQNIQNLSTAPQLSPQQLREMSQKQYYRQLAQSQNVLHNLGGLQNLSQAAINANDMRTNQEYQSAYNR